MNRKLQILKYFIRYIFYLSTIDKFRLLNKFIHWRKSIKFSKKKWYFKRNNYVIQDNKKISKNCVNINWYPCPDLYFKCKNQISMNYFNIGDLISYDIYKYMLMQKNLSPSTKIQTTKHLYGVGSIIDKGHQDAVIWGSGLLSDNTALGTPNERVLDIRCVRGPKTRKILIEKGYNCPEIYGDPAILLPQIYKKKPTAKYDYLVIPHYSDLKIYNQNYVLSPLVEHWKDFIDKLVQAKLIISSSLHGIIIAEAYGIPAIMLQINSSHNDNYLFKYKDYYLSTNRKNFPIATSIEDALNKKPLDIANLKSLQNNLFSSFPYDLWTNK